MLRLDENHFNKKFNYAIWLLMAFQAGYVNVGAFVTSNNYVSHVTGTSSNIGINAASGNWITLLQFIIILFSFIGGAAFAGHFIGKKLIENKEPHYIFVTFIKSLAFGAVVVLAHYFITPEKIYQFELGFEIIPLLSFCCGVQNSTCSLATGGFLKPTHMTGLSTDLGLNLTQVYGLDKNSEKYKEEKQKNRIRMGILTSFIAGGFIAQAIFRGHGGIGFLFPFLSSLCFLGYAITLKINKDAHPVLVNVFKTSVTSIFVATFLVGWRNIIN